MNIPDLLPEEFRLDCKGETIFEGVAVLERSQAQEAQAMSKRTPAQELLATHLMELDVHVEFEVPVCEGRKFAFDLADDENRIGFECDGGQWSGGHMRGKKLEDQYEKDRLAQLHGWRIMRFTNRQILNGEARAWLREHLYPL